MARDKKIGRRDFFMPAAAPESTEVRLHIFSQKKENRYRLDAESTGAAPRPMARAARRQSAGCIKDG
jgi:hypothetical protein